MPKPWEGHGWKDNGEPLWCNDDMVLPVSLVDILIGDAEELLPDDSDEETHLECAGVSEDSSTMRIDHAYQAMPVIFILLLF